MSDINYCSISDKDGVEVSDLTLPSKGVNPLDYSDTLKLSKATNVLVKNCYIVGGKEDCVDMNRYCESITIQDTKVRSNGRYCFTIKGGSKNITLKNIVIEQKGSEVDIDIGNWSDQSSDLTTNIILDNVSCLNGDTVNVRVLWGDKPIVIGGNVKVKVVPKILVKIYRLLRKLRLVP
jgi:polygalacturonase